jgi:hypothetical protein
LIEQGYGDPSICGKVLVLLIPSPVPPNSFRRVPRAEYESDFEHSGDCSLALPDRPGRTSEYGPRAAWRPSHRADAAGFPRRVRSLGRGGESARSRILRGWHRSLAVHRRADRPSRTQADARDRASHLWPSRRWYRLRTVVRGCHGTASPPGNRRRSHLSAGRMSRL